MTGRLDGKATPITGGCSMVALDAVKRSFHGRAGISRRRRLIGAILAIFTMQGATPARAQEPPNAFPLRPVEAAVLARTSATRGQEVISVPVTYTFTGTLTKPVQKEYSFLGVAPIAAGTPVFGLPTSAPSGLDPHPQLLWCAIEVGDGAAISAHYSVACFPKSGKAHVIIPMGGYLFPAKFGIPWNAPQIDAPVISEHPVNIHVPLTLSLRFDGFDGKIAGFLLLVRQPGSGFQLNAAVFEPSHVITRLHVAMDENNLAHVNLFGGEILLKKNADGKTADISLEKPFPVPPPTS